MTSCRPFELLWKRNLTPSASLLRFAVADGLPLGGHGRTAPTGVKVHVPATGLEKSYSPVSHPAQAGSFDLLVKAYPPRAGGGVGAYICALQPGEKALMKVKPAEFGYLAGAPLSPGRWKQIGLVACGTGLAPLYQVELDLMVRNPCFRLHTQLSMPTGGWPAKSSGRITSKTLGDCLPAPDASSMILVCGTDGFVDTVAGPIQRITLPNGQKRKC
ncbi:unnamed protein product [Durusdinium trenchii]|uniref:FAD-binding FR-type domain-containing protein n=1 Tax=Durusdinium trenchii TaxID=1381693 RepID=A0ABP0PLQ3_9DINO